MRTFQHFIFAGLMVLTSSTFASDEQPRIVTPPINYSAILKQIERIKTLLKNIDLRPSGDATELVASAPDYIEAYGKLATETQTVLQNYLTGMEKLLENSQKLTQENGALAAYYQAQVDALINAAKQATGEERSALFRAADQQAKDSQKLIELNTNRTIDAMTAEYAAVVTSAFNYQSVGAIPKRTRSQILARNALLRTIVASLNIGAHLIPAASKISQGQFRDETIIFTTFFPFCALFMEGFIAAVSSDEDVSMGQSWLYGVMSPTMVRSKDRAESKASASEQFLENFGSSLFKNCKTSVCVYRLGSDYKRFFKALSTLDNSLEVGTETLESPVDVRYAKIKRFLNPAIRAEAQKRPTAIFTPAKP